MAKKPLPPVRSVAAKVSSVVAIISTGYSPSVSSLIRLITHSEAFPKAHPAMEPRAMDRTSIHPMVAKEVLGSWIR